jgi:hypothetical protein
MQKKPIFPIFNFSFTLLPIILIILLSAFFISCGEDAATQPEPEFDPPRFNWSSMDLLNTGYSDIWAQDTSNIYMTNYYDRNLCRISNGNITVFNAGNYGLNHMQGLSNNEIYIFGCSSDGLVTLIKWDGAGFNYYPTNINLTGYSFMGIKGYARNSNEVWICCQTGIALFDGVNYQYFSSDDSTMMPQTIFLSENNTIQYISQRIDESGIKHALYELRGNSFVKLFEYFKDPSITRSSVFLKEIRGIKFGIEVKQPIGANWSICFLNFQNYSFSQAFCFNSMIQNLSTEVRPINPAGTNLNNYVMFVEAESGFFEHYRTGLIHWDGNKYSKELGLSGAAGPSFSTFLLFNINESAYLFLEPHYFDATSKLYIGTKK